MSQHLEEEEFPQACALICRVSDYDNMVCSTNRLITTRYPHERCILYFPEAGGAPQPEKCVMFQFGEAHIMYDDKSRKVEVVGELSDSISLSVQIFNFAEADDFSKNVKV